jgi:hypothetical protein
MTMTTPTDQIHTSPFACSMDAIASELRQPHIDRARKLFTSIQELQELPDGYAFKLPNEVPVLMHAAEFIALERLCCPFFAFTLSVEPEGGAMWLKLTGGDGIKPFIRAEIGEFVGDAAAF